MVSIYNYNLPIRFTTLHILNLNRDLIDLVNLNPDSMGEV